MTAQRHPDADDALDVETLLSEAEPFTAVVDGDAPGPLAVVGDPFAGREPVLDHATERLAATRVRLDPGDGVDAIRDAADGGPLVVGDCQHLYRREIGGFEPLEAFLDVLATAEGPVVTGWNRYAWAYLSRVRELAQAFESRVEVGSVATERLAELLLARYEGIPEFVADESDRGGLVTMRRVGTEIAGRSLSVPVPAPNLAALRASRTDATPEPRDVVFERLAAAADGNVGVATALWERSRADTVRPSDVATPSVDLTLDREENFCLRVLLAKERVQRQELAALVDDVDRILARLRRADLASVTDGIVALEPAKLPAAVASTDRSRIL